MNRIYRNTTEARFRDRADKAYYKYLGNIGKTDTYKADLEGVNNAPNSLAMGRMNTMLLNREYPRNQYMGLNTGG